MTAVFVYGTLKQDFCNAPVMADQKFLGRGVTAEPGYKLYNIQGANYPYPAMVAREDGYRVYGEVYEASDPCLKELDYIEGVSSGLYHRDFVTVLLADGQTLEKVTVYLYNGELGDSTHCGPCWPMSELHRCKLAAHEITRSQKKIEIDGVRLWDLRRKRWVTTPYATHQELVDCCNSRPLRFQDGKGDGGAWSPKGFEERSYLFPREVDSFQIVSLDKKEEVSPDFPDLDALCKWASENMTLFGGKKATSDEWQHTITAVLFPAQTSKR